MKNMNGIGRKTGKQGWVFPSSKPDRRSDLLRKRKRFCKTPDCDLAPKRDWRKGYCTWHARTQQGLSDPNPKRKHHAKKVKNSKKPLHCSSPYFHEKTKKNQDEEKSRAKRIRTPREEETIAEEGEEEEAEEGEEEGIGGSQKKAKKKLKKAKKKLKKATRKLTRKLLKPT